jgi:hypothetical protein
MSRSQVIEQVGLTAQHVVDRLLAEHRSPVGR